MSMSGIINNLLGDFFSGNLPNPKSDNVRTSPPKVGLEAPTGTTKVIARTYHDVLKDISDAEAERDNKLAWCQDGDEIRTIRAKYKSAISELWGEYYKVKGE